MARPIQHTRWQRTVYVGAFPLVPMGARPRSAYLAQLDQGNIDEVQGFLKAEARSYGVSVDELLS